MVVQTTVETWERRAQQAGVWIAYEDRWGVRMFLVMDNLLGSPVWSPWCPLGVLSPTPRFPDHHPTVGLEQYHLCWLHTAPLLPRPSVSSSIQVWSLLPKTGSSSPRWASLTFVPRISFYSPKNLAKIHGVSSFPCCSFTANVIKWGKMGNIISRTRRDLKGPLGW